MKRPFGLAAWAAVLLLAGCSPEYAGERFLWKAERLAAPIFKDPNSASPEAAQKAIQAFARVIRKAPGTASAAKAQVGIGFLHAAQRRFDFAREAFDLAIKNYGGEVETVITALVATAKSYEAEGDWPSAEKVYRDLSSLYPWSSQGMEAPLYIGDSYSQRGMSSEARQAYEKAVQAYEHLLQEVPSQDLGARISGYLLVAYERLENWKRAAEVLDDLLRRAPDKTNHPMLLFELANIYLQKLRDPAKAKAVYDKLIAEYPDHALARLARENVAGIEESAR